MNVQEIISSGALELYAMQALSPAEMVEMEQNLIKYPALRAELEQIELSLEQLSQQGAISPSENLLENIHIAIEKENETPIIPIQPEVQSSTQLQTKKFNPMSIAASVLLLCSVGVNIYYISQNSKLNKQNAQLLSEKTLLAQNNTVLYNNNAETIAMLQEMANDASIKIPMGGTEAYPTMKANVIFNEETHKTYVWSASLPKLTSDQQYQLWALVDGKPVDLGVFDSKEEIIKLKSLNAKPQAFAVTIEQKGGKSTPTLSAMCLYADYKSS